MAQTENDEPDGLLSALVGTGMGDFTIHIRTGDRFGAGTDANVKIILHGSNQSTKPISLNNFFKNDFKRGHYDTFHVDVDASDISEIKTIELWRDSFGLGDNWYVDKISVENHRTNETFVFPIFRWIKAKYHYKIHEHDTLLPQFDDRKEQRKMELDGKKKDYVLEMKSPGLPVQVKELPMDEKFSLNDTFDFVKMRRGLEVISKVKNLFLSKPKSFEDIDNLYTNKHLPMPLGAKNWRQDQQFGAQRLTGVNINIIKLCTAIPDKLGVDDAMVRPSLEGLSLDEAIRTHRVYMTDLEILDGLKATKGHLVAPIALFFVNSKKQLMPIAIQLHQQKGPDNPVFLPSDDEYLWILAKIWYNMGDGIYHQALAHITFTHFCMESFALATQRHLSISHPLHKLLAPHFLYLMAINSIALVTLVAENGFIDQHHNYGRPTVFELAKKAVKLWRVDVDGTLPVSLKQRGVDDPDKLPNYHYRDDAMLFYKAINNYVRKYVNLYYDTPEKITGDYELKEWVSELVKSKDDGGMGIMGIPGNGNFTNTEEIIVTLTCVIFQCSVGHAAVNFPQYDEYGYQLRYTSVCHGEPPKDKKRRTEQDVLDTIADNHSTLEIMRVVKLLSTKKTESLGLFEVHYIYDPEGMKCVQEFRKEIRAIKDVVEKRNKTMEIPYTTLHPDFVPNAVSI